MITTIYNCLKILKDSYVGNNIMLSSLQLAKTNNVIAITAYL